MTSGPKFGLCEAGGNDGRSPAHAAKRGCGLHAQFPGLGGNQVGHLVTLQMRPHVFHWIEFGSVCRQPLRDNSATGSPKIVADQSAAMDSRTVPEDEDAPLDMALQMRKELHDLLALDAALVDLKKEAPQCDAADDGEALPVEAFVQQWRLSAQRPSAHPSWLGAQSAFVDKDDGAALFFGVFFNIGHVLRFQVAMAFSSRSKARRSGL